MTDQPSQNTRVLVLLRERGERGLNSAELAELPTCDGGPPVRRIAARVHNLTERGFEIRARRQPNGTATYFLISEPSGSSTSGASRDPSAPGTAAVSGAPRTTVPRVGQASGDANQSGGVGPWPPLERTQASPAPAEPSLFDATQFGRPGYEDAA